MKRFWMCVMGERNAPVHQHPTKDAAIAEAERLLLKSPYGTQVCVLEAILLVSRAEPPVIWEKLTAGEREVLT